MQQSKCKYCQHPIYWMKTAKGKGMPVNTLKLTVLDANGNIVTGYEPHWGTCPEAERARSEKKAKNNLS